MARNRSGRLAVPASALSGVAYTEVARVHEGKMKDKEKHSTIGQDRMSVLDHLDELRRRIIVSLLALVVGVVAAFIGKDWVFFVVERPLKAIRGPGAQLVTFSPTEPFMTIVRVSVYVGLIIALPVILYEVWAFIMPALYEREKRSVLPYVLFTLLLFLGGVAFGYFVVLPIGLSFLIGYGGDIFNQQLRASEYLSFVSVFLLGFGVVFEMPAFILLLSALGVVSTKRLRRWRKYAVLVIAVVAMVITPSQDPVSMLLMMGPLLLLYELGIGLGRLVERRRERRRSQEVLT
jgi:sec-independent protein translocase protein TatC